VRFLLLYALLLKATLTSFSGLSSLPVVRNDLVVTRQMITDRQLNTAVAVARMTPGPLGLYLVNVGYFAAGVPGAAAGFLAMITPAFLILPLLIFIGSRADHPSARRVIRAVILGAAGLLLSATLPLAQDALRSPLSWAVMLASLVVLVRTRIDTAWVILGSALVGLIAFAITGT